MNTYLCRALLLPTLAFAASSSLLVGCDGASEGSDAAQVEGERTQNNDDDPNQRSGRQNSETLGDEVSAEPACAATANALFETDQGELRYTDANAELTATHAPSSACVQALSLTLSQGEGCRLHLELGTTDGAWALTSGALTLDDACADAISAPAGTYTLDSESSTGGLDGQPKVNLAEDSACASAGAISLTGVALFSAEDSTSLNVNLNGVTFSGDLLSAAGADDACPADIAACTEVTCGQDAYGKACGECAEGEACIEGSCRVWNCPPGGPFGTMPGETLTNVELKDCDGNTVFLHDLCGADAAYFNLLAGW